MDKMHKCKMCEKEFNRSSSARRHERTVHGHHLQANLCPLCGTSFNRLDSYQRHVQKCDGRPRKKPSQNGNSTETSTRPSKRPVENDSAPPPKKPDRTVKNFDEFPTDLVNKLIDDPELLKFYRTNWRHIRPSIKKTKLRTMYNCHLPTLNTDTLKHCAEELFEKQTNAFKINVSFGFILRNNETNERKFYYSSTNTKLFESPYLVKDRTMFNAFLDTLVQQDPLEYAQLLRPNSKWVVDEITNVTFFVYHIRDHPIGAALNLPEYVTQNRAIVALSHSPHHKALYKDNLCLFRSLALHSGAHSKCMQKKTESLYHEYTDIPIKDFTGVNLEQLHEIEDKFKVNIVVYELVEVRTLSEDDYKSHAGAEEEVALQNHDIDTAMEDKSELKVVARLVRRSLEKYESTLYLNLYNQGNEKLHFSYITDIERYTKSYVCGKCYKLWKTAKQLHRHEARCECQGKPNNLCMFCKTTLTRANVGVPNKQTKKHR